MSRQNITLSLRALCNIPKRFYSSLTRQNQRCELGWFSLRWSQLSTNICIYVTCMAFACVMSCDWFILQYNTILTVLHSWQIVVVIISTPTVQSISQTPLETFDKYSIVKFIITALVILTYVRIFNL